jgi:hypothetical protein
MMFLLEYCEIFRLMVAEVHLRSDQIKKFHNKSDVLNERHFVNSLP